MQWLRHGESSVAIHRFLDQLVMHDGEMGGCTAELIHPSLNQNATLPRRKAAAAQRFGSLTDRIPVLWARVHKIFPKSDFERSLLLIMSYNV